MDQTRPISPEVLAHYGVLGMKWGVRKDGGAQGSGGYKFKEGHKARKRIKGQRESTMGRARVRFKKEKAALKNKSLSRSERKDANRHLKTERKDARKSARATSGARIVDRAKGSTAKAVGFSVGRNVGRIAASNVISGAANIAISKLQTTIGEAASDAAAITAASLHIVKFGAALTNKVLTVTSNVKMGKELTDIYSYKKNQRK